MEINFTRVFTGETPVFFLIFLGGTGRVELGFRGLLPFSQDSNTLIKPQ
jgi:hypothetical protein